MFYTWLIPIVFGSLSGALITYCLNRWDKKYDEKRDLFIKLMEHRNEVSPELFRALYLVDIVYYKNENIRNNCHEFILELSRNKLIMPLETGAFINMLLFMAKELKFNFDERLITTKYDFKDIITCRPPDFKKEKLNNL